MGSMLHHIIVLHQRNIDSNLLATSYSGIEGNFTHLDTPK
jgi:hypothetical protein